MARNYVSNKNESVRMFENDFLEFFSHIHPATPVVLFIPLTILLIYFSYTSYELSVLTITGLFAFGIFIWTFLEYTLHRFVFHYEPKSAMGKRMHFMLHGVHHDYPNDGTRLVMTPAISVPFALFFYGVLWLLLGSTYVHSTFAGLIFGYVCYDMIHYATHHFPMKNGLALKLKQHHMRHHYQDDTSGYGVSSPFWDYVFGTRQKKNKQA